jgi:hypothetical protein
MDLVDLPPSLCAADSFDSGLCVSQCCPAPSNLPECGHIIAEPRAKVKRCEGFGLAKPGEDARSRGTVRHVLRARDCREPSLPRRSACHAPE